MSSTPQIWLTYRPIRIGWIVETGNVSQLLTALSWSTCLWGGRFTPIITIQDTELANDLIANFCLDALRAIDLGTGQLFVEQVAVVLDS